MKSARIDVLTHGVRISQFDLRFARVIGDFLRKNCMHTQRRRDPRTKRVVIEPLNTYASVRSDYTEVYLLRQQYELFKHFISDCGYRADALEVYEHDPKEGVAVEFDKLWKHPWKPEQEEWLEYMDGAKTSKYRLSLNTAQTGAGKALPIETLIKVPNGWKRLGDLQIGDEVVTPSGRITYVTGISDNGFRKHYRILFDDGRSLPSCADHQWKVYDRYKKDEKWHVVTTQDLVERIEKRKNIALDIPLPQSDLATPHSDLPFDPYLLGRYFDLGDLPEYSSLPKTAPYFFNEILAKEDGIPLDYLTASHMQRLNLLQGLMDANGSIRVNKQTGHKIVRVTYMSKNPLLASAVQYLVRSLGGKAKLVELEQKTEEGGYPVFTVFVQYYKQEELFTIPEIVDQIESSYDPVIERLEIRGITPDDDYECRCITVADPEEMFIAEDFIATHNTAMALEIVNRRSVRTGIMLSPKYIKNWYKSLFEFYNFEEGEVIEVRGAAPNKPPHPKIPRYSMSEFQELTARGELDYKIAIFSINMFQRYITDYERTNRIDGYEFYPYEFWEKTNIGLLIQDECHEFNHFLAKIQCYAKIPEIIYLSATVDVDDPFIENIFKFMYPRDGRLNGGVWKKYIVSTAITYALASNNRVRYKGYGGSYSHTEFEKQIMAKPDLKRAYFQFIYRMTQKGFMDSYQKGQKAVLYCATVSMCQSLASFLQDCYPELTIGAYTQKEDFEVLLDNDISVSTVKSAGTGVDIANLVYVFMTLAMGSKSGNIQVLGRLRILRGLFEGWVPNFNYLVCRSIEAHVKYHEKKREFFGDKVLRQEVLDTDFVL